MGYEIKMLVGKTALHGMEHELDKENPFKDGSGFPYKKDKRGDYIETGRKEAWFQIMAEVDLCKLGYQEDVLNRLIDQSHDKKRAEKEVVYFYGTDGNTRYMQDRYDSPMFAVPIKKVLDAMKQTEGAKTYRRLVWAIALLEAMASDEEQLEVMFWGH